MFIRAGGGYECTSSGFFQCMLSLSRFCVHICSNDSIPQDPRHQTNEGGKIFVDYDLSTLLTVLSYRPRYIEKSDSHPFSYLSFGSHILLSHSRSRHTGTVHSHYIKFNHSSRFFHFAPTHSCDVVILQSFYNIGSSSVIIYSLLSLRSRVFRCSIR